MARPRVIYATKPDPLATCRPLGVEIWEPAAELLTGWVLPTASDYRGGHGLRQA